MVIASVELGAVYQPVLDIRINKQGHLCILAEASEREREREIST